MAMVSLITAHLEAGDAEKEEENREIAARAFFAQLFLMSEESEQMKYGMLGEDARPTEEKLAKYRGQVDWTYLKPHFETSSLYFVDPALKLAARNLLLEGGP
jgi:hypothetical protein